MCMYEYIHNTHTIFTLYVTHPLVSLVISYHLKLTHIYTYEQTHTQLNRQTHMNTYKPHEHILTHSYTYMNIHTHKHT